MQLRVAGVTAVIAVALVGCSSGSSKALRLGESATAAGRTETVYQYAEQVLGQSYTVPPGNVVVARVKVCAPKSAKRVKPVHVNDYELILATGEHLAPSNEAPSPRLEDGPVAAGTCVRGFVSWDATSGQHPTIKDTSTGASWKPNCSEAASGSPCQDFATSTAP